MNRKQRKNSRRAVALANLRKQEQLYAKAISEGWNHPLNYFFGSPDKNKEWWKAKHTKTVEQIVILEVKLLNQSLFGNI